MIPRTCATAARLVLFLTGSLALSQQQPIDLMFALETSHGTEQAIGLLNQRALKPGDRAGVIGVNGRTTRVLQPLTDDREALATAIQRAGIRVGVALGGVQVDSSWTVDLATDPTGVRRTEEKPSNRGQARGCGPLW